MTIDPTQAISQFVGSLPLFISILLAWMNSNGRFSDIQTRISDGNSRISDLKGEMRSEIQMTREILRAEFKRVEEVMDARIKHLEEHQN